jgi:uncharacterized membrane protein YgcG
MSAINLPDVSTLALVRKLRVSDLKIYLEHEGIATAGKNRPALVEAATSLFAQLHDGPADPTGGTNALDAPGPAGTSALTLFMDELKTLRSEMALLRGQHGTPSPAPAPVASSALLATAVGNIQHGLVDDLLASATAPSSQQLTQSSSGPGAGGFYFPSPSPAPATTGAFPYVVWLPPAAGFPAFAQEVTKFEFRDHLREHCDLDGVPEYLLSCVLRWTLGAHTHFASFAPVSRNELHDLAHGEEGALMMDQDGSLKPQTRKRKRVPEATTMSELISQHHNFGRVISLLRGKDDILVQAHSGYVSQLHSIYNEGQYDVIIYDRLFRTMYWKDLATAMNSYHEWHCFNNKAAMLLLQPPHRSLSSSGGGGGSGSGSGSGSGYTSGSGAARSGGGAGVSWAPSTYPTSGTGGNNNNGNIKRPNACNNYNRGSACRTTHCPYDHICSMCGGTHSRVSRH